MQDVDIRIRPRVSPARRTCLSCGRAFRSEGPWNRICARCRRRPRDFAPRRVPPDDALSDINVREVMAGEESDR